MTESISIPFLLPPNWALTNINLLVGHHYKQPIPYVIPAGVSVELNTNYPCTISILNTDQATENVYWNVNGNLTVTAQVDSVVFVGCIFVDNSDGQYRVEFEINGSRAPLVHIRCGENNYKSDGVDENQSLVFIEGKYIQLLMPRQDLPFLNDFMRNDPELDTLNDFYNTIVDLFNDTTGTGFQRKYFGKCDLSHPSYVNIQAIHTNVLSLQQLFFDLSPRNSNLIMAISYLYVCYFEYSKSINLEHVWWYVLADLYQYTYFTPQEYLEEGFKNVRKDETLSDIINNLSTNKINQWAPLRRLIFITTFFFRVGHKKLMRDLFKSMVDKIYDKDFNIRDFDTLDEIVSLLDRYGIDVVYSCQVVGIKYLDRLLLQKIKYNTENTVNVFEFLVRPGVLSLDLVEGGDTSSNEAVLQFIKTPPLDIIGCHYTLMQSKGNEHKSTFTENVTQSFGHMRTGCYKLFFESGNSNSRYNSNSHYVVFDGTSIAPAIELTPIVHSNLLVEMFYLYGHMTEVEQLHKLVAIFVIDYYHNQYVLEVIRRDPNFNFRDSIYYSIEIQNVVKWDVMGTNEEGAIDPIEAAPLSLNQSVIIYHAEAEKLVSAFETSNTNVFTVTLQGLRCGGDDDADDAELALVAKIVKLCEYITASAPTLMYSSSIQDNLYLAYNTLSEEQRKNLEPIIAPFLPNTRSTSITILGFNRSNLLRAYEIDGFLRIVIFENANPSTRVLFRVLRNNQRIYNFETTTNGPVIASENSIQLLDDDTIHLNTENLQNRIIVANGSLNKPTTRDVLMQWKSARFELITIVNTPDLRPLTLVVAVAALIIIIIVLFKLLCMLCSGGARQQTVSPLPSSSPSSSSPPPPPPPLVSNPRRPRRVVVPPRA
ncbi:vef-3 [Agrotis segetum nucleopolyhedrovirus B]|uniref:Vef-3 n=1 Tax=Agrotis segetum nucleopolyhedrovirus B TaxID=1580580 RepID=A0A0A7KRI9_9ABAC|nr:vef-3 [Agrotis segetum nucleopolyhedrovirus B]AIZ48682.1 vef-3 [Agrotis segetum nucleopolyhedrovirus B]